MKERYFTHISVVAPCTILDHGFPNAFWKFDEHHSVRMRIVFLLNTIYFPKRCAKLTKIM